MELSSPILAISLLTSILFFIFKYKSSINSPSSIIELIKNRNRILEWSADLLLASPSRTITTTLGIITADPLIVKHTLETRCENYIKGDFVTNNLYDLLGGGIVNANGDSWKLQRRTANLEFTTKTIRNFIIDNIVHRELSTRLLPFLLSAANSAATFDLQELLERFAFNNICKVVFNEDPAQLTESSNELGRQFFVALNSACYLSSNRFRCAIPGSWKLRRFLSIGDEKKLKKNIEVIDKYVMRVIKSKKSTAMSLGKDLLSRFIEENKDFPDQLLRDIIITFIIAGRDNTSATLTWFFWVISTRPEITKKIMNEIQCVREKSSSSSKNDTIFTLEEVKEMNYLHAALSETLRLYPPTPLQLRTSKEEDVLPGGLKIAKNKLVMYHSYVMGRSEKIWGEDCREFRPERWLNESGEYQPVSPYKYPVFHAGPRMCLGKNMAYIQMKVVAASVMEKFEVEVLDEEKERMPELLFVSKMKEALMVRVRERVGQ